jgi:hypothetical protein
MPRCTIGGNAIYGGCAMRHDPASAAVEVMLRGLKMYGMGPGSE